MSFGPLSWELLAMSENKQPQLDNMAGVRFADFKTDDVEIHNYKSFSLHFHKFQCDYTNNHSVAVGTQPVTINKATLFLPPHTITAFLMG